MACYLYFLVAEITREQCVSSMNMTIVTADLTKASY